MAEQDNLDLVNKGFDAFNSGDVATLSDIIHADATQNMPGNNKFSGLHTGRDDILGMYGQMGADTNGTFGANLQGLKADGPDRVIATYKAQGERNGKNVDTTHDLAFDIKDGKVVKMDDSTNDVAAWDDFWD